MTTYNLPAFPGDQIVAGGQLNQTVPITYDNLGNMTFAGYVNTAGTSMNTLVLTPTIAAAAGGTTNLTSGSHEIQILTGSTTQIYKLPDATTLSLGQTYQFINRSTGALTINDNGSSLIFTTDQGATTTVILSDISTAAGTWNVFSGIPANGNWQTASFNATGTIGLLGTTNINTTGSAVTNIGTGGTGAVNIGNTTGNVSITGSLTASTTLTATAGAITTTDGNFVNTASGTGRVVPVVVATGPASGPVTANGRLVQVTFSSVSIGAGADLALVISNSAITNSSTIVNWSWAGATTSSALSPKSAVTGTGTFTLTLTNGTGATTSVADVVVMVEVLIG